MERAKRGFWSEARGHVKAGKVVFFPRRKGTEVYSIFAGDRKAGVKIHTAPVVYQECPGVIVWRTN